MNVCETFRSGQPPDRSFAVAAAIQLSSPATKEHWEIPVLFADAHLLALAKPAGLLTSPDRYDPHRPNLMTLLHRDLAQGARWARELGVTYLANVHRLDFPTSGVLLLAKDQPTLEALVRQFGTPQPVKNYVALVHGTPREDTFRVEARLAPHPVKTGLMRIDSRNGKPAVTEVEVLERYLDHALLRCRPRTGRTHQIRVHLQSRRLPIVADETYGGRPLLLSQLKPGYRYKPDQEERPLMRRAALHAEQLAFVHPHTGCMVEIHSAWPKDLRIAVKYLRRYAALSGPSG